MTQPEREPNAAPSGGAATDSATATPADPETAPAVPEAAGTKARETEATGDAPANGPTSVGDPQPERAANDGSATVAVGSEAAVEAPGLPRSPGAPSGDLRLKLFARTDVGQIREHNEDNFLVADLSKRSRGLLESNRTGSVGPFGHLFAVCDGMGGAAAGEVASQLAVDIIYERMVDGLDAKASVSRDEIARRLVRAVETAGFRIFQEAKADRSRRGMGTTVTASALVDDHLFFAQVGDSRGYILRDGVLTQVTRDQSLVNQLIEAGQLTAEEAETFEHNNIILQALGTSDTVQVDLTYARVRQGDVMLLCSDGLSGMVRFDEIREIMRTAGEPVDVCKALTERANMAGGHDNITVIIVAFDGEGALPRIGGSDAADASSEPLRYRKYPLPEEDDAGTERNGRAQMITSSHQLVGSVPPSQAPGTEADDTTEPRAVNSRAPRSRSDGWHEEGPHGGRAPGDERIDIPGTHVPAGIVVAIVIGVVAVLAMTAIVLLR